MALTRTALAALTILVLPAAAAAQTAARLTGLVFDSTRNVPLAGAEVILAGTSYSGVTNDDGRFLIPDVPPGTYLVTFRHSFLDLIGRDAERIPVELSAGEERDIALVLRELATAPQAAPPPALPGASGRSVLLGRVVEAGSGRPVAGASVAIAGTSIRIATDNKGRFVLYGIPPGPRSLEVSMIGYRTRSEVVEATPNIMAEVTVALSTEPIELPPLDVTVRSHALESFGYYERRDDPSSFGHFIERVDLEKRSLISLEEAFQTVPGVEFEYIEPGRRGIRFRRAIRPTATPQPFCTPRIWLDGVRLSRPDIGFIPIAWVEAIEVYVGATAPQPWGNACGALMIWTRRG